MSLGVKVVIRQKKKKKEVYIHVDNMEYIIFISTKNNNKTQRELETRVTDKRVFNVKVFFPKTYNLSS